MKESCLRRDKFVFLRSWGNEGGFPTALSEYQRYTNAFLQFGELLVVVTSHLDPLLTFRKHKFNVKRIAVLKG